MAKSSVVRVSKTFDPIALYGADAQKRFAADARATRDGYIARGEASPKFTTAVNGVKDAPEETVKLDGGTILYTFEVLADAVAYALERLRALSPVSSGKYRDAWIIGVNQRPWHGNIEDIPTDAEVWITNPVPYARLLNYGIEHNRPARRILEKAMADVKAKFPQTLLYPTFLRLSGDFATGGDPVPWILKGHGTFVRKSGRVYAPKARMKGMEITYPALVLRPKF